MNNKSIRQFLADFDAGKFDDKSVQTQIEAGWYDWFCDDNELAAKTKKLTGKLKEIVNSPKIDQDKCCVFFKNNCPFDGSLYDDFRICHIGGGVVYTVVPASGHKAKKNFAEVWGEENGFNGYLVEGSWQDVLEFFNGKAETL
jgi:hypothetical protein